MREQILGLGVGGLMFEQRVGGLAFHVGLPGEDEDLDGGFVGRRMGCKRGGNHNRQNDCFKIFLHGRPLWIHRSLDCQ